MPVWPGGGRRGWLPPARTNPATGRHSTPLQPSELTPASPEGRRAPPPIGSDRTRLGRRLHPEPVGQPADLGRRIAAVATKGLQERELAFGGPAGHGLGRHLQDGGHLGRPQVAGRLGCGLAAGLGCHGASLSCGGPDALSGPNWRERSSGTTTGAWPVMMLARTPPSAGRTGRSCRPGQLPAIA
jgi:hypothetical protein